MPSPEQAAAAAFISSFATAYDGALLGLTLALVAARSFARYFASTSSLTLIHSAPSARVSDLRSLLSTDDVTDKLVVVRGQVQIKNHEALVSQGEAAVIVQQTQMCLYHTSRGLFRLRNNFQFLRLLFSKRSREPRSSFLRSVPFVLVEDGERSDSTYVRVNLDGSTHSLPLTMVYHRLYPVESPWYSFIWTILGHRYPVAILDEERILPVGKEITAVGICRNENGALEIKSCYEIPYFLCDMTKDEIEADLTLTAKMLFWSGVVLGTVSISILGYSMIRNWQRWKEFRRSQNQESSRSEEPPESNANEELEDVPDGELCVICLVRRRVSAFLPCGHRVCCQPCAISVKTASVSPKCPVCRQRIRSSIRIYNS